MTDRFEELVIESLGRLEEGIARTNDRMDRLVDTTNHRLDDFREDMEAHQEELRQIVELKADKTELIVPVVGRFLDTWPKRFVAFSAGVGAATTGVYFIINEVVARFF